ncbi:hypothetical protein [Legionella clemsonensis]|uniref:Uncharacterized protein n=1 Tax=Legionella clemsonensis TaxID=1867846 RepID=A0A222P1Y2_9GAMM|nr:hypothetical protein [Legionella clemsonensis]ASQ45860.1 hypothetical protein clem_06525 [Legionella clemsonensis]
MSAIEKKIHRPRSAPLWHKTGSIGRAVARQEKSNLKTIINHCSIIMKSINGLEPMKQECLTREVLIALREIQFLQDSATSHKISQKNFDTKFEDALTSLAKVMAAHEKTNYIKSTSVN